MPQEQEDGFVFRDRRRSAGETAPVSPVPASVDTEDDLTEDDQMPEMDEAAMGALPDIHSVLTLFLQELRSLAWLRMGLVANPSTGKIERDMEQARIAIDTVAFLAKQLEPAVSPEERLPLKALVSDLQINFVEQLKRS